MSNQNNQTSTRSEEDDDFPIAAIICIAVGGYVVGIILIIVIRHVLTTRGSCKSECCQSVEDGSRRPCCCVLCAKASENCTCCTGCHVNGCLTKICGKPKRTNCIDILLCNCGGCTEKCCTGCNCSCGFLRNIVCCSSCTHPCSCFSCQDTGVGCCCFDVQDSRACGCLCLEVKLRSPRQGSLQRRHSAPLAKGDQVKQFSTHFPPMKDKNGETLFVKTGLKDDFAEESIDRPSSNVRLRSTSLSPHKMKSSVTASSNESSSNRHSRNRSASPSTAKSSPKRSDESVARSGSNVYNNSISSKSNLSDNKFKESFRNSRHRRSIRVGQQSQRFPKHVLVSSESFDSGKGVSLSSSIRIQSMPVAGSVFQRPLPPLRNTSQQTKLSKTN